METRARVLTSRVLSPSATGTDRESDDVPRILSFRFCRCALCRFASTFEIRVTVLTCGTRRTVLGLCAFLTAIDKSRESLFRFASGSILSRTITVLNEENNELNYYETYIRK